MAWQEVETDVGAKVGRVKYSVSLKHGGARVTLPKPVVDQLGWKKTSTLRLLVGAGELEGKLRIEAVDKGRITAKSTPTGDGLIIRLGRWPQLAPRDVDGVHVDHEVDKPALIITLPRHAQLVAPDPRTMPATPRPQPVAEITGRDGTKVDVTSRFFNDPKKPPVMAAGTRGARQ